MAPRVFVSSDSATRLYNYALCERILTGLVRRNMIQSAAAVSIARAPVWLLAGSNNPQSERDLMKIHEYQGKEILRQFGVPVPRGKKPLRPLKSWVDRSGW
jgi:hypothetical protein